MFTYLQSLPIPLLLVIATVLEVSGDAVVRMGIHHHSTGVGRIAIFCVGGLLLFGYGYFLNTAPVEFGRVVGLYIATLFIVWQIINFLMFRTLPALPVWVGGILVVAGGLIITFWRAGASAGR